MASLEGKGGIHKQAVSVIKMHSITSTSKENMKRLHRISNQRQRLSPDFCLSSNFSSQLADTSRREPRSCRFFKKQLKTHEPSIKKNPRINLIQNTQKIISSTQSKIQKYVLHSTKKLQILSQSYHHQNKHRQKNAYFTSIMSDRDQQQTPMMRENNSSSGGGCCCQSTKRRRKSPQGRGLCKGTTMRKRQVNIITRFSPSPELERYRNNNSELLNEQQLPQQTRLTLYESLIYTRKLKAQSVGTQQLMESSLYMMDDSKLDRERFLQGQQERKVRNRQLYNEQRERECKEQFPKKRVEGSSPEVLKIHLKRAGLGLRGALLTQKLDRREYYQPRSLQVAAGARRPNTTVSDRRREDSEIEPW